MHVRRVEDVIAFSNLLWHSTSAPGRAKLLTYPNMHNNTVNMLSLCAGDMGATCIACVTIGGPVGPQELT